MTSQTHEELLHYVQSKSKLVALIYSPIELHEYIVKIIAKDIDLFIQKGKGICHFHSLKEAIGCAREYGAEEFYLGVDNTHDECGTVTSTQPFDYIPILARHNHNKN